MAFFYWFVWIVGIFICIIVYYLYKSKKLDGYFWYLFWVGFILGLLWEVPLITANEISSFPPARFIIPPPLPSPYSSIVIIITHSLWDGGLFLLGVWFIQLICKKPILEKFKLSELIVMIAYGQISTLIVELLSTSSGGWEYYVYLWNPLLFTFIGHNITLLPQLIWLAAPIIFYFIAIKLKPRINQK
ncbi:MAG: hypothetical protein ACFE9N_03490 [Promethearchaeota archaeon]